MTQKALELTGELYAIEAIIFEMLPRLQEAVVSPGTSETFDDMLDKSDSHLVRLEHVFRTLNQKPSLKRPGDIESMLSEALACHLEFKIIAATRDLVKAKIKGYSSLIKLTSMLHIRRATKLVELSLMDEYAWEQQLTHMVLQMGRDVIADMGR